MTEPSSTYPTEAEWSSDDASRAAHQGWGIFDCDGSDNGRTQLCRLDESDAFTDDDMAWKFVVRRAAIDKCPLALRAIEAVRQHNQAEYTILEKVAADGGWPLGAH